MKNTNEQKVKDYLAKCHLTYSKYREEHDGWFFCTVKQLMEGTGIKSNNTVLEALKEVIKEGYVEKKSGGNHKPNLYRITAYGNGAINGAETVQLNGAISKKLHANITSQPTDADDVECQKNGAINGAKNGAVNGAKNGAKNGADFPADYEGLKREFEDYRRRTDDALRRICKVVREQGVIIKGLEVMFK